MSAEQLNRPELLIGKEAKEVVLEILRLNPRTKKVSFVLYHYVPKSLTGEGRETLVTEEVSACHLEALMGRLRPGFELGIFSRVELNDGSLAHIPMIDFCCLPTGDGLEALKEALRKVVGEKSGWLLDSGNSFHFYSPCLKSQKEWLEFLGRGLLCNDWFGGDFKQLVDTRYIGHSLISGGCSLRLSNNVDKRRVPIVVDVL